MPFTIVTWNINSVRLRLPLALKLIEDIQPDLLCLQETKCRNEAFPASAFAKAGYPHQAINGQKGYHGVATLSRHPFVDTRAEQFCDKDDARHVAVTVDCDGPLRVHNVYVPAGGDEPDPEINDKFAHKLSFLEEMTRLAPANGERSVLVGDLNVAPYEDDVWSHRQLLKVVCHTPVETELFERTRSAGGWDDAMRRALPVPDKIYTWWSYRARDWRAANRGRRLDHVWTSPALAGTAFSMDVLVDARDWEKPSDHVPVVARFG